MADSYTKLFRGITASTIVSEPLATRWLWITLLALTDKNGNVWGSIPGLARIANISIQECEAALASLQAPDPYSRTKDNDGRRIVAIDGGWHIVNHAKYDAMRSTEDRREYKRNWDRQHRPSGHARAKQQSDNSPTVRQQSDSNAQKSDSPAPPTPTPTPSISNRDITTHPADARRADSDSGVIVGTFEGHEQQPIATNPNPVAPFARALNAAGFRCTAMNPDLVAYVRSGGAIDHLLACADECRGKPATYVIRFAQRELDEQAACAPVARGGRGGGRRLSAVELVEQHIRRAGRRHDVGHEPPPPMLEPPDDTYPC